MAYLTANGRSKPDEDSGYVFNHCRLTAEPGVDKIFLGRPWRDYAKVIYLNTEMGAHILPEGWSGVAQGRYRPAEDGVLRGVQLNRTGCASHRS